MNSMHRIINIVSTPSCLCRIFLRITGRIWPDELYLKMLYRLNMGQKLNLKEPRTFNEKLQWLKLYNRRSEYTTMVDKYAVKEYVASKIGAEFIIPTLGVWNTPEEIDWDMLPNQFVLKTTHGGGGGGIVICNDKSILNIENTKKKLKKSLKNDIYLNFREWPYKGVRPRIIAEKFMTDESGTELKDYKFFCFNGKVRCFKIDFDRFNIHKANYYDRNAKLLPFGEACLKTDPNKLFETPINFEKMIELSETLSRDIPFVRVDLYNVKGRIYFGELTFFPAAGMGKFAPEEWDEKLGQFLVLP